MKILLDEMLPAGVTALLPGLDVTTVKAAGDQVLVTADRNMLAQQNVPASGIALVLVPGNRLADIGPRASEIQAAVQAAKPGTVTRLARPG